MHGEEFHHLFETEFHEEVSPGVTFWIVILDGSKSNLSGYLSMVKLLDFGCELILLLLGSVHVLNIDILIIIHECIL